MSVVNYALDVVDVNKRFGGVVAAQGINVKVKEHEIYGIIGPNGAGKTTLFNIITGVYAPTSGDVKLFGKSIVGKQVHEIAEMGIARTFQNIRLFGELTVFDNLLTSCQKNIHYNLFDGIIRNKKYKEQERKMETLCNELLEKAGIAQFRNQRANNLPYGMQRRLEIMRGLITGPKVLLLDEPAAGMNEEESAELSALIKKIRDENDIAIVVIDHHMDVIMEVCDQISVINFGCMLVTGTPEDVRNNKSVQDAYLGVDEQ